MFTLDLLEKVSHTLQFWSGQGKVTFGIAQQNPHNTKVATSQLQLATGKWYYVVGNWDLDTIRIYVFGQGVTEGGNNYALKTAGNTIGAAANTDGPIVIGSQLTDAFAVDGFYGFDGKINGVKITNYAKTASELETFYLDNADKTVLW